MRLRCGHALGNQVLQQIGKLLPPLEPTLGLIPAIGAKFHQC